MYVRENINTVRMQMNRTTFVGCGCALVETMTFNRRVVASTPALAATYGPWASPLPGVACLVIYRDIIVYNQSLSGPGEYHRSGCKLAVSTSFDFLFCVARFEYVSRLLCLSSLL